VSNHRASRARWSGLGARRKLILTLVVFLGIGGVTVTGSLAAWNLTTVNPGNTFSTSSVLILDNQGGQGGTSTSTGTAMFNISNLSPGSTATTRCIGVNFSGTATVTGLTLSAALAGADQTTLQGQLTVDAATYNSSGTVTVTPGSNTNSGSCTNYPAGGTNTTVGTQGATMQSWAGGGPYTITTPVTNTWYKFTISGLPNGANDCTVYCGRTITMALTWTLTTA
jgi:hypothetical protein